MRVLEWIVNRCKGRAGAYESAVGWMPESKDFRFEGLTGFGAKEFEAVQNVDREEWYRELLQQDELFFKLYERLPKEMVFQRELLVSRL